MADSDGKVRIIIDTNAEAATKQLNNVGDAFKKNADTIQKSSSVYSGYEKTVKDNIEVLRELALGGNQNTEGFRKLAEQTKEYKQALDEANSTVNKAVDGIQKQASPVDALTSKLKGLIGAYIGIRGVQAVFNYTMQATEAYRQQERAIASLNTTLANAGVYTEQYSKHIQSLASEIQSYSNYGDEAIIKAQALGQSFIGQTKITDELTRAVVDFASATGMDLEQAFSLVGKSIGSETNALGRYGIELKKGMTDAQKMEAIQKQLAERYEGSAKSMANASTQLKNAVGDLAESFGQALDPAVKQTQAYLLTGIKALTAWIHQIRILHTEINNLSDLGELQQRYAENTKKINKTYDLSQTLLTSSTAQEAKRKQLQAEQTQILSRIALLKKAQAEEEKINKNRKVYKYTDEFTSFSSNTNSITKNVASPKINTSNSTDAKQIKDSYDLATEAVEKARRAVLNAGIQFGTSSPEVAKAFEQYKQANEKIQGLQDIFKTAETKTKFQQLQEEITNTTVKLQELYLSGQNNSDAFIQTKNHLSELQTQLKDMNTAITSNVGLDWENVANSIRSNLTSAILTPLQDGESAFNRLGRIGLNVVQMIGQEIISNLLKQITLEKTLQAIKTVGKSFGGFLGGLFGSADGNVFQNGRIKPFANGGVVTKPTLFPMANGTGLMGEAGPEAIMPLTRKNGRLGVEATQSQTVVNIYNQSGANIETQKRDDGGMDIFIKKFNSAMNNERTSGAFRSAYQRENSKGVQAC